MESLRKKATGGVADPKYQKKVAGRNAPVWGSSYNLLNDTFNEPEYKMYKDPGPGFWKTVEDVWNSTFGKRQQTDQYQGPDPAEAAKAAEERAPVQAFINAYEAKYGANTIGLDFEKARKLMRDPRFAGLVQ